MIACPNCRAVMRTCALAAHETLGTIDVDACVDCRLFWFDRTESLALAPESVVRLFRMIGDAAKAPLRAVGSMPACPRCGKPLALTHDLQRTTRFTYWRCAAGHGRLIAFAHFLREKNFVREPSRAEIERLRATVRQIACSQCGAPIDLVQDAACAHCGSPIALIDPAGVAEALGELDAARTTSGPADPDAIRRRLAEAQATAIIEASRTHVYDEEDTRPDLLRAGAGALAALVAAWLARS